MFAIISFFQIGKVNESSCWWYTGITTRWISTKERWDSVIVASIHVHVYSSTCISTCTCTVTLFIDVLQYMYIFVHLHVVHVYILEQMNQCIVENHDLNIIIIIIIIIYETDIIIVTCYMYTVHVQLYICQYILWSNDETAAGVIKDDFTKLMVHVQCCCCWYPKDNAKYNVCVHVHCTVYM